MLLILVLILILLVIGARSAAPPSAPSAAPVVAVIVLRSLLVPRVLLAAGIHLSTATASASTLRRPRALAAARRIGSALLRPHDEWSAAALA
jgi:hypothetical protein